MEFEETDNVTFSTDVWKRSILQDPRGKAVVRREVSAVRIIIVAGDGRCSLG